MIVMLLVERALASLAGQLGEPTGLAGRIVGRMLNRGNRSLVVAAVKAVEGAATSDAADIGFGGGVGLDLLLSQGGAVVHGVEMSETMLADAGKRFASEIASGRLRLHGGRMERLPLDDSSLDAIISTNTIYFVSDLVTAMKELARVLRPGGRLALGVGDPEQMSRLPFTRHGFRLRPIDEVIAVLREVGFGPVEDRRLSDAPGAFHLLVSDLPVQCE